MSRSGVIRSRSALRIAIFSLAALLLAALSFSAAVGEVFVRSNPVLTKSIGLGNRAQANLYYTLLLAAAGQINPADPAIMAAAKDALAVQPLNARALQAIAASEFQAKNHEASLRFAKLTEQVSRREFGAHILLFQDAVLRNDLPTAFEQLDVGMRTSSERRTLLFPALTRGLQVPEFREGLAPIIDQQRDWAPPFLMYAVDEGGAAVEVARLFGELQPRTRAFLVPSLSARTITRLTDAREIQAARQMFASLPGKDAATLSDPGMTEATFDPEIGSLGWQLEEGPTLTARIAQGNAEGSRAALIDVGPGDSAPALSRILFMNPGTYSFSASARKDQPGSDVASQWTMRCLGVPDAPLIWTSHGGSTVAIPARCPAQLLQLMVTQVDASTYGQLLVENVSLRRS